jgi:metalloendopeptidase OMA1, mitochondrial
MTVACVRNGIHLALTLALVALTSASGCVKTPVTGRRALVVIPLEQEKALGAQTFEQMLQQMPPVAEGSEPSRIVQRVGDRVAAISGHPDWPWEFRVFPVAEVNAFALPGGKVGVYTGLLNGAANEAELAAVIAHEVGHAIARHGGQRLTQQLLVEAGLAVADITLENKKYRGQILGLLGVGSIVGIVLPFSRAMELEADRIGLELMARAGYDPRAALSFWARMAADTSPVPAIFSTHPPSDQRLAALQRHIATAREIYAQQSVRYGRGDALHGQYAAGPAPAPPASSPSAN